MDNEAFYKKLKKQLEENTEFPSTYMYKFIVPNDNSKVAEIQSSFDNTNAEFSFKNSKSGKFISVTIRLFVLDADTIINYYKKVIKIEGIISL